MASNLLSCLPLLLLLLATTASSAPVNITGSRDITKILDQFPNFSTLNKLLTQTKVVDQINSRQTITVLVVADSAMSSAASLPADVLQKVLSVHVILDYYDIDKISNLPNATGLLTTLFQASGNAVGKAGFLNATDVGDGQVKLGSAVDSSLTSEVIREIAMQPYNISVIEISQVIVPPGIASAGNGSSTGSSTPASAPKAETPAPKAAPQSPKAAPAPKASTSPSPSASSPAPKTNSSDETPTPTADAPSAEAAATAPSAEAPATAPSAPEGPATSPSTDAPADSADAPVSSADAPASSADAPAGSAADEKASSASRLALGVEIGAAVGAAFLVAL